MKPGKRDKFKGHSKDFQFVWDAALKVRSRNPREFRRWVADMNETIECMDINWLGLKHSKHRDGPPLKQATDDVK